MYRRISERAQADPVIDAVSEMSFGNCTPEMKKPARCGLLSITGGEGGIRTLGTLPYA